MITDEFNDTWEKFKDLELNKPGTVIRLVDGRILLIGDINGYGGLCNCCTDLRHGDMIKNYYSVILEDVQ